MLHHPLYKGSRLLIHSRSAHDPNMKFNVCVNEVVRIIKNCSIHLEWEHHINHLEYFIKRLQFSGYDHMSRYKIIQTALKRYEKLKTENNTNGKFFDNLVKNRSEKKKNNVNFKKSRLGKNGKYQSVLYITPTPESELQKRIQNSANKYKIPIKVIERVNESVKKNIQKSNPFNLNNCGRFDCMMCRLGSKTSCRVRGIVYELRCVPCSIIVYRGQSSRSGYERINEHFDDWKECREKMRNDQHAGEKSVLNYHSIKYHNNNDFQVEIKIISQNFGDPMKRLITESVLIDELDDKDNQNRKKEWSYVRLPQVTLSNT